MKLHHALPPLLLLVFTVNSIWGQSPLVKAVSTHEHNSDAPLFFVQNEKQWHEKVAFRTRFEGNGVLFLEDQAFTYLFTNPKDLEKMHRLPDDPMERRKGGVVHHHAYRVQFIDSRAVEPYGVAQKKAYHNYFLGNDPAKWAGRVPIFGKVVYEDLYNGIDLEAYSQEGHFKYDLRIEPGSDPGDIQLKYEGAVDLEIVNQQLIVKNSIQTVIEMPPYAFQEIDGLHRQVPCFYQLNDRVLSFDFPEGYDPNYPLIIDPTVVAATIAGMTENGGFGHAAAFDNEGNIYTAGRVFGETYPVTTGAFQTTFDGQTDIGVTKYNPDGSNVIYSTYLGGAGADLPHSIIVDFNQQLYIFSSSNSLDYPVTPNAFQTANGGEIDIVVSIFTADGSDLVGSSYFGGVDDDGINNSTLNSNYDDHYRGEIIVDNQNNVYVVGSTSSADFPVTSNAYDTSFNPVPSGGFFSLAQDAVVLKANSDLSVLYWATYLGEDQADIGNGIRVDDELNVYVTGTAGDSNFPTTTGSFAPTWPGGEENAYLAKISADGSTLMCSTFFGTSDGDEHAFFLDIDERDNVHIYGQTTGTVEITPNTFFANLGSRQFLAAFNDALSERVYSTVIGTNSFTYSLVPDAFMVDKCDNIYFSGYYASESLPVSPDAVSTQGDNFYLGVLAPLATDFVYGTYYGDANHVDGGTSRFDKAGIIYQAVCSCLSPTAGILSTLPNAWATDQVTFCDIGVFKIDFEIETVIANAFVAPSTSGCAPFAVDFTFTGQNAVTYDWDFGDGATSTDTDPSHTFNDAGSYEVELIVRNDNACNPLDTFYLQIDVLDGGSTRVDTSLCGSDQIFLDATTLNASYSWQDGSTVSTYTAEEAGIYWVDVSLESCSRRDSFVVDDSVLLATDFGADTSICDTPSYTLDATDPDAVTYLWQDGSDQSTFTATTSGTYSVELTDMFGCIDYDEIELIFAETPIFELANDTSLCAESSLVLTSNPPDPNVIYTWSDGTTETSIEVTQAGTYWLELDDQGCKSRDTIVIDYYPPVALEVEGSDILCADDCNGTANVIPAGGVGFGYQFEWETGSIEATLGALCPDEYSVTVTDGAGCVGEGIAVIESPEALQMETLGQDIPCANDANGIIAVTGVTGGIPPYRYAFADSPFGPINFIDSLSGGTYGVSVMDANECLLTGDVMLHEPMAFSITAGEDITIKLGEEARLEGQVFPLFGQELAWRPSELLDCSDCPTPSLLPLKSDWFTFTVTDLESGCFLIDSVKVNVLKLREVYIPNAFSPNNDGINDLFFVYAGKDVSMVNALHVFDRWGNQVYSIEDCPVGDLPGCGWDGSFKGKKLNPGVFTYFAEVLFIDGAVRMYKGDVSVVY